MSFKVRIKPPYRAWPVTVTLNVCDEETGSVAEMDQGFVGHFLPLSAAEIKAIRVEVFGDEATDEVKQRVAEMLIDDYAKLEAAFFARVLCGWGKVVGEDGDTPVPYSADALRALATGEDGAAVRRGLNRAINEITWGVAPLKNAKTSPAPGQNSGPGGAATS